MSCFTAPSNAIPRRAALAGEHEAAALGARRHQAHGGDEVGRLAVRLADLARARVRQLCGERRDEAELYPDDEEKCIDLYLKNEDKIILGQPINLLIA